MIENILVQIHPNDRAVAAAALSLYLVKRSEGWSISNCMSQINPDTPLWVDATLEPLEESIDQIPALITELVRSVEV